MAAIASAMGMPHMPALGGALECDFLRNQCIDRKGRRAGFADYPGVSFSRAGTRYSPGANGALTGFAANVPRITSKGLAAHSGASNLFLNSDAPATQGVSVTAQAYTLSFYGTGSITLSGASTAGPLNGTGADDRVSLTFTPGAGALTLTVAGSIDKVQLETGSYATPYIPAAGTTASAAADFAALDLGLSGGVWTNAGDLDPSAGFWVLAEFEMEDRGTAAVDGGVFVLSDNPINTEWWSLIVDRSGTDTEILQRAGGVSGTTIYPGAIAYGTVQRAALQYDAASNHRASLNGAAVVSNTAQASAAIERLVFGDFGGNPDMLEGFVRRLVIGEGTLTDAQLRGIST